MTFQLTGSARTFVQALVSLGAAAGTVLVIPLAILALGVPVALAVRGVLEIAERLLAALR